MQPAKALERKPQRNHDALEIEAATEADMPAELSKMLAGPHLASALVSFATGRKLIGSELELTAIREALKDAGDRIHSGDLSNVEAMLHSQAIALNLMFAEMNRSALRALHNGASFEAGRALMGISLKAQSQCRTTLETLANIKNPPTVFAKQANIANGPQQVNNGITPPAPAREKKSANQNIRGLE